MRKIALLFVLLSFLFLLCACGDDPAGQERTLWIVTEESSMEDGMTWQAEQIVKEFKSANPDVTVTLEILPDEKERSQERSVRLEKIRADILAGNGPDVYLLPNETFMEEPMFRDVQQAMHNGVFADISSYYDADVTLGREELITEVMDGGVADGARYVLPLRYTYPVLYADQQALDSAGLDLEASASDFNTLWNALLAAGDPKWHCLPGALASTGYAPYLPRMIDYATGEILITEAQIADFLRMCQAVSDDNTPYIGMSSYIYNGKFLTQQQPVMLSMVDNAVPLSAIAKTENKELASIPVRAANGELVACVTYYAAVGNGCSDPELAYEFVREFLTEDVQLEHQKLERSKYSSSKMATGLPVRSDGKAVDLWAMEKKFLKVFGIEKEENRRRNAVMGVSLTQADVPVLDAPIDRVYFATVFDQQVMAAAVGRVLFEQADIDTTARELIYQLELHAGEG